MNTIISLDVGYRHLKMYQFGNNPIAFDSVYADLIGSTTPTVNKHSAIFEYIKGNHPINKNLEGKRWIAGSKARDKSLYHSILNYEKTDIAIRIGLLSFIPVKGQPFIDVDKLIVSLPERRDLEAVNNLKHSFIGEHRYKRNGEEIRLNIKDVKIEQEGIGTFWMAKKENLIVPNSLTGIIDLGGKTCNLLLLDENGDILDDASGSLKTGGTYHLASLIASDPRLIRALKGDSIKLDILMDCLAMNSRIIGTSGVSFEEYYNDYLMQWLGGILADVKTKWQRHFHRIGRILLTGGSSNLIKNLIANDPTFAVPSNPQFSNVVGLVHGNHLKALHGGQQNEVA
ncbi:MAG: ParM/StbA family protein [Dolichospermum sp.]